MSRRVLVYPVIAIAWLAIALGLVACGSKPGDATATTGAASQVTTSSAVVSGEVDAQGHGATYYFEYGENTSYGSNTPSQDIASEEAHPVTATLSNLDPDTTYHYQLVVRTSDGKLIKGGDQTFQTASEGGGGGGGAGTTTGGQTTGAATTRPLTTVQPTTAPLTTVRPTTGPLTTVQPTTGPYTTVRPTTGGYTTVQPTTGYTTVQPTTSPPTTVQPTTGSP